MVGDWTYHPEEGEVVAAAAHRCSYQEEEVVAGEVAGEVRCPRKGAVVEVAEEGEEEPQNHQAEAVVMEVEAVKMDYRKRISSTQNVTMAEAEEAVEVEAVEMCQKWVTQEYRAAHLS